MTSKSLGEQAKKHLQRLDDVLEAPLADVKLITLPIHLESSQGHKPDNLYYGQS